MAFNVLYKSILHCSVHRVTASILGKEHSGPLDDVLKQIVYSIQSLGDRLENKIEQLQTDMDCFCLEIKENLDSLKATISGIEKSLEQAWEYIEDHTAELKAHKDVKASQQKEIHELKSELQKTSLLLNVERENNIALENYTRRQKLEIHESTRGSRRRLQRNDN